MMTSLDGAVSLLGLLAEPTRVRLLALLGRHELSVAELVGVLGVGQSSVSTHLGKLREAGLVRDRKEGASVFYALNEGAMPAEARVLWGHVEGSLKDGVIEGDRARGEAAVRARGQASWPEAFAGEMERHYSPGRTWEALARAVVGLVGLGEVLDVGAGDGTIAQLLAPQARGYTLLDRSEKMIEAARARLRGQRGVKLRVGDAHDLPFDAGSFDEVFLFNVLTCAERPAAVVAEAARVLRPGGRLLAVALGKHDHLDAAAAYHHIHPGFTQGALRQMLRRAGLDVSSCEATSRERRPPHFEVLTAFATKG